jgi:hypothetical protein
MARSVSKTTTPQGQPTGGNRYDVLARSNDDHSTERVLARNVSAAEAQQVRDQVMRARNREAGSAAGSPHVDRVRAVPSESPAANDHTPSAPRR